jgi:hypothetical protein
VATTSATKNRYTNHRISGCLHNTQRHVLQSHAWHPACNNLPLRPDLNRLKRLKLKRPIFEHLYVSTWAVQMA